MTRAEMVTWSRWACTESRTEVGYAGLAAREIWIDAIIHPRELQALREATPRHCTTAHQAAESAANAAVEVAIVCSIWPEPLDAVLRPARQQRRLR